MNTTLENPPFLDAARRAEITTHMNEDHADSVLAYVHHFGGLPSASSAVLAAIDAEGLDIVASLPEGDRPVRIAFEHPLADAEDAHTTLVAMARAARAASSPRSPAPDALSRAREAVAHLSSKVNTLLLGTASPDGSPDCSVAPFIRNPDGSLSIFISELSTHTRNLRAHPFASALLIEDEASASHLLARRRLTLRCAAAFIPRDAAEAPAAIQALKERFGPIMNRLETMHDFHLVRLSPASARLVAGFGQAYDADPSDWNNLVHVGDTGHRHAPTSASRVAN